MSDFTLSVNGVNYAGWTTLRITRGIEQLAHSFSVGLTDKWSDDRERIPVRAGDSVKVKYGTTTVITGYVDDDTASYSAKSRSLSFSGRSKTADLVDCAAKRANKKRAWRKTDLLSIARDLCDPFGIEANAHASVGAKFNRFSIEEGETAFTTLARAARMRGLLLLTTPSGDLVFDRAGTTKIKTALVYGDNILSGNQRRSLRDRFSEYTIKCQVQGSDETADKPKTINLRRTAEDADVSRYRPTTIMADTEDSGTELQKRADWERNVRAGQSRSFSYTVRGWENSAGLWTPNTIVAVTDPQFWLDKAELLISGVTFNRGDGGTSTALELKSKAAFDIQPLPITRKKTKKTDGVLG